MPVLHTRWLKTFIATVPLLMLTLQAASAQDTVTLSFVGPEANTTMQPVIDAFQAANPNIIVNYEQVPFADLNDILQTRIGGGDSTPDIFTADQPRIPALVDRGFLEDITNDVGDISDRVIQSSIDASTVNGRLYALPMSTSTQLLYYNADLLEVAGIDLPTMDPQDRLTWEALTEAAVAAQEAGAEYGFMFDQVSRVYQILPLPESLGGGNGISTDDPLSPAFTNDAWVDALTFYGDLFKSGIAPRGVPPEQTPDLFASGRVAFFVGGPWWLPLFSGIDGLNFGVSAHPYFADGEPVTPTGAWSWGINPNTQYREEALQFLTFAALTAEGASAAAINFPLPPANIAAFEEVFVNNIEIDGLGDLILYELQNTAVIRPLTVGFIQFEEIVGQAMEDIRNGADVSTTLETATEDLQAAWSRLG